MIKKFITRTYNYLKSPRFYKSRRNKVDLLIYDTIYPNPISGFRLAEFTEYLEYYPESAILVNPTHYATLKQSLDDFERDLEDFADLKPSVSVKIRRIRQFNNINCNLFYCVFYSNIVGKIKTLNRFKIPFTFTLYPGGGFNLKSETGIKNLRTVCSSKFFRGVIVTQAITRDYLINNNICKPQQVHYIFGGIVPQNSMNAQKERFFRQSKDTLDICFCAAKYMEGGKDKGYDIFVDVAVELSKKYNFVRFHVIGGFDKEDTDVHDLGDRITFHGYKRFDELQDLFRGMDLILSPNRPNVLGDGLFDGFPLGAVVEAALNGVIPIVTDELSQNDTFSTDEIFICRPAAESFVLQIEEILDRKNLRSVSDIVKRKFREVYSHENQLSKRVNILNEFIER